MIERPFTLLAIAALAACGESNAPFDPVWGKQPCAGCGMVVGDRHHAAQLLPAGGARVYFDDPGCLIGYLDSHPGVPEGMWVRDSRSDRWLDARMARYQGGARTPMDFGFEARADEGISFTAFAGAVREQKKGRGAP